jgi:hypothetical protein
MEITQQKPDQIFEIKDYRITRRCFTVDVNYGSNLLETITYTRIGHAQKCFKQIKESVLKGEYKPGNPFLVACIPIRNRWFIQGDKVVQVTTTK